MLICLHVNQIVVLMGYGVSDEWGPTETGPVYPLLSVVREVTSTDYRSACTPPPLPIHTYFDSVESKKTTQATGPAHSGMLPSADTCGQLEKKRERHDE